MKPMWPSSIDWKQLKFGVEIEFAGGSPEEVELLHGWVMSLDERLIDERGEESGSEFDASSDQVGRSRANWHYVEQTAGATGSSELELRTSNGCCPPPAAGWELTLL